MYPVLITDDERSDRNIIKILLEKKYPGMFQFIEAENGQKALEILHEDAVELMFLDINMPGLSGLDVMHQLSEIPYTIVLTAYDSFTYLQDALRCRVKDYLLKPPLRTELYQSVDRFLAEKEQSEGTQLIDESHGDDIIQTVLTQVRDNCAYPWSIDFFANKLYINSGHLSRIFKEKVGVCFTDYLTNERIEHAIQMMRRQDLTMSQIGEMVGYQDSNYFSRVFKKQKGMTPREYAKKLQLGQISAAKE